MPKNRLDHELVTRGLAATRSQAENYVKLGYVRVNGQVVMKAGLPVDKRSEIKLDVKEQYVSRAAFKLASAVKTLGLSFKNKTVLDVGSSTGGFTDYALRHGASRVIAVDVGTNQMHPSLRADKRVDLREKTDIRSVTALEPLPDIVLVDVSFISLRDILPHVAKLVSAETEIVAMVKPQFEATGNHHKHKGVVKNDRIRRDILKQFEDWTKNLFTIRDQADSEVTGVKGNRERFYRLQKLS